MHQRNKVFNNAPASMNRTLIVSSLLVLVKNKRAKHQGHFTYLGPFNVHNVWHTKELRATFHPITEFVKSWESPKSFAEIK